MPSNAGPDAMAKWPLEWKLGREILAGVVNTLAAAGLQVWDSGQALLPQPFGPGRLPCKFEAWQPGLVCKFRDGLRPALITWREYQTVKRLARPVEALLSLLITASPPARFSPYAYLGAGRGLFAGREEEMSLLLGPMPALVISGESGMGKTSLLLRAAHGARTRLITCQAYSFLELQQLTRVMAGEIKQAGILFLDEMDGLLRDPRTFTLLRSFNRQGTAWRAAVHRPVRGIGPNYRLPPPRGLAGLLLPLEKISGYSLDKRTKALILAYAAGNPRRLQYLANQILALMGQARRQISVELVNAAAQRASACGENSRVVGG